METYSSLLQKITNIEKTFVNKTDFLSYFKNLNKLIEDRKKFNSAPRIKDEDQLTILIKSALALKDLEVEIQNSGITIDEKIELNKRIRDDIRFISSVIEPGLYDEEKYR
ncbi:MAG: hypothetical protein IJ542_02200 [Clostridia bacterium]|nr:hypothetical protein [Clostridia bacterium]